MITKTQDKIEFKNVDITVFELPNDSTITKFLDNWYFFQNYSKIEKDISIFKINYISL